MKKMQQKTKRKYKLNYKKIKRNIVIIFIFVFIFLLCKTSINYSNSTENLINEYNEYLLKNDLESSQENYKQFVNSKN